MANPFFPESEGDSNMLDITKPVALAQDILKDTVLSGGTGYHVDISQLSPYGRFLFDAYQVLEQANNVLRGSEKEQESGKYIGGRTHVVVTEGKPGEEKVYFFRPKMVPMENDLLDFESDFEPERPESPILVPEEPLYLNVGHINKAILFVLKAEPGDRNMYLVREQEAIQAQVKAMEQLGLG